MLRGSGSWNTGIWEWSSVVTQAERSGPVRGQCGQQSVPRTRKRVLSHLALLRVRMHRCVDYFRNKMGNQREEAQVEAAQGEMEEELSEDIVEYLEDHIQENLPESLQESSLLYQEVQQGLCHIFQRPSVSACLEVQNLEESIWDFEDPIDILQGRMHQLVDNFCETLLWKSKDEVCSDFTELESTCSAVVADSVDAQVNNNSGVPRNLDSLRAQIHRRVDYFCDMMGNQPEKAQMEAALAEMEEALMRDILEFVEDSIQEKLPESQQESRALLLEARQEVRRRIQRPSVSASLEVQNPEESIWARAWRRFLGFLQSLRQRCWDVLTWLREKAAAILEAICRVVEAVWRLLSGFSSSVGQLFGNLIQV